MTIGEKLLNLSAEYQDSLHARAYPGGEPSGREPAEIAADYEAAIRSLVASSPS